MTAANKKHYEPLSWDGFFDEISYLDDVILKKFREHLHIGQAIKELYSFVSTVLAIQQ